MGNFWPWERENPREEPIGIPPLIPTTDKYKQPEGKEEDDSDDEEPVETQAQYYYRTYTVPMEHRARRYNNLPIQEQDPSSSKYWWRHDIIKARDKDPKGSRGFSGAKPMMMNPSIMLPKRIR
jgi:hypothetical protein